MVGVCGKFYTLLPYYRPKYENFPPRIRPKSLLIGKKKLDIPNSWHWLLITQILTLAISDSNGQHLYIKTPCKNNVALICGHIYIYSCTHIIYLPSLGSKTGTKRISTLSVRWKIVFILPRQCLILPLLLVDWTDCLLQFLTVFICYSGEN